ncbi:DUF3397 domain-containing protein [Latilactobacillus sakei]
MGILTFEVIQMPFTATLFFILLPLICLAIGYGLNTILQRFFKKQIHFVDWLPVPLLISAIALSQPFFNKAGWFFCLAICLWGIVWSLTRFYYDHALYPRKFFKSWWRFVLLMASAWYLAFLVIALIVK